MAKVLAIALKSFYFEKEVKTRASKAFEVYKHHFFELKHNKLVDRAPEEKSDEADAKAAAEAEAKAKEEADAKAAAAAAKKAKA